LLEVTEQIPNSDENIRRNDTEVDQSTNIADDISRCALLKVNLFL